MSAQHTPTPWQWEPEQGQFILNARHGTIVAEIPCRGCNPADGEFIVRACNSHEALLAACKAVISRGCGCHSSEELDWHSEACVIRKVRAAIKLAEGEQ